MVIRKVRKKIKIAEPVTIESLVGSKFTGRIYSETTFGDYSAIIPESLYCGKNLKPCQRSYFQ